SRLFYFLLGTNIEKLFVYLVKTFEFFVVKRKTTPKGMALPEVVFHLKLRSKVFHFLKNIHLMR
ncbi:MAG: hypothetical protein KBE38_02720, partial [Ignavibacterium sp.]|nr:hypothetical protein [Ignavibacterium sp.]